MRNENKKILIKCIIYFSIQSGPASDDSVVALLVFSVNICVCEFWANFVPPKFQTKVIFGL